MDNSFFWIFSLLFIFKESKYSNSHYLYYVHLYYHTGYFYGNNGNIRTLAKGATLTVGKATIPELHSSVSTTRPITKPINIFEKWDDFYDWLGDNEFNRQW